MGGLPTEVVPTYAAISVAALGLVAIWIGFLVWGWRSGQLQDSEQAKYRVFDDELSSEQREGQL